MIDLSLLSFSFFLSISRLDSQLNVLHRHQHTLKTFLKLSFSPVNTICTSTSHSPPILSPCFVSLSETDLSHPRSHAPHPRALTHPVVPQPLSTRQGRDRLGADHPPNKMGEG